MVRGDSDLISVPAINWDKMEDDYSKDQVRYSFLHDNCNV